MGEDDIQVGACQRCGMAICICDPPTEAPASEGARLVERITAWVCDSEYSDEPARTMESRAYPLLVEAQCQLREQQAQIARLTEELSRHEHCVEENAAAFEQSLEQCLARAEAADALATRYRSALERLANEVTGAFGIAEVAIRSALGNTNAQVLRLRLDEARQALEHDRPPSLARPARLGHEVMSNDSEAEQNRE